MILEKRKKKKKIAKIFRVILTVLVAAGLLAGIVFGVFRTQKIEIVGNEIYDDMAISNMIMSDEYCKNSLYLFVKYNWFTKENMPFVDTMEVSFKSPTHLIVKVYEKAMIGCFYDEGRELFAYFDKDGVVMEQSDTKLSDVILVNGMSVASYELYKVMELEDASSLSYVLALTQGLQKYELEPNFLTMGTFGTATITFDEITVKMGKNELVEEKLMRLQAILGSLSGRRGTLDLSEWTSGSDDIIFHQDMDAVTS